MRNTTLYGIAGSKFMRLSSKAVLEKWGTNLQNIERGARTMYVADEGKKFLQRDQSGAEALIVAYLARPGNFRDLFLNGVKPHVFVGLHLFWDRLQKKINDGGLDIKCDIKELLSVKIPDLKKHPWWKDVSTLIKESDDWPAQERYYYIAKQVCHSSNYGIRAGAFCLNTLIKSQGRIVLTKKDAERFLEIYHGLFPEIREWHRNTERQLKETRMLFTIQGYPLYFSGDLENERYLKECFSSVPQSSVAIITHIGYTSMQRFIEASGRAWDMLNNCHDSFLLQFPDNPEEEQEAIKISQDCLEQELVSPRGEKFKMRSEVKTGYNWGSYHPTNNPNGLREI